MYGGKTGLKAVGQIIHGILIALLLGAGLLQQLVERLGDTFQLHRITVGERLGFAVDDGSQLISHLYQWPHAPISGADQQYQCQCQHQRQANIGAFGKLAVFLLQFGRILEYQQVVVNTGDIDRQQIGKIGTIVGHVQVVGGRFVADFIETFTGIKQTSVHCQRRGPHLLEFLVTGGDNIALLFVVLLKPGAGVRDQVMLPELGCHLRDFGD